MSEPAQRAVNTYGFGGRFIITRNGLQVDTTSAIWGVPGGNGVRWLNFNDLLFDDQLRDSAYERIAWLLARHTDGAINSFSALLAYSRFCDAQSLDPTGLSAMSAFKADREPGGHFEYVRAVRAWYIWCLSKYRWPAFSEDVQLVIEKWSLRDPERYLAIRRGDADTGPLDPAEDDIVKAAISNTSVDEIVFRDLTGKQVRALVAVLRTLGVRPQQVAWLKRRDLQQWEKDGRRFAVLSIPRLKNGKQPRAEFKKVRINERLLSLLENAITDIPVGAGPDPWLFSRRFPSESDIALGWTEQAWRPKTIDQTVKRWSASLKLTSPITGKRIHLVPRRLRYTFATNLAPKVSPQQLAEVLDHKDVRTIAHYYTYAADFFDRLATIDGATKWGEIARTFLGLVESPTAPETPDGGPIISSIDLIEYSGEIVGLGRCGSSTLCRLYPPLSCYLCPRFRPDPNAPHEDLLNGLAGWRSRRPNSVGRVRDALQDQLDDVIKAIGHLLVVLRVFNQLRPMRHAGLPRPELKDFADSANVSVEFLENDRSISAYLCTWPSPSNGQRRISKRRSTHE